MSAAAEKSVEVTEGSEQRNNKEGKARDFCAGPVRIPGKTV